MFPQWLDGHAGLIAGGEAGREHRSRAAVTRCGQQASRASRAARPQHPELVDLVDGQRRQSSRCEDHLVAGLGETTVAVPPTDTRCDDDLGIGGIQHCHDGLFLRLRAVKPVLRGGLRDAQHDRDGGDGGDRGHRGHARQARNRAQARSPHDAAGPPGAGPLTGGFWRVPRGRIQDQHPEFRRRRLGLPRAPSWVAVSCRPADLVRAGLAALQVIARNALARVLQGVKRVGAGESVQDRAA